MVIFSPKMLILSSDTYRPLPNHVAWTFPLQLGLEHMLEVWSKIKQCMLFKTSARFTCLDIPHYPGAVHLSIISSVEAPPLFWLKQRQQPFNTSRVKLKFKMSGYPSRD